MQFKGKVAELASDTDRLDSSYEAPTPCPASKLLELHLLRNYHFKPDKVKICIISIREPVKNVLADFVR